MQIIKFDKDAIKINCIIKFGITNSAYQGISKSNESPENCVAMLSKLTRLIITPIEHENDKFELVTSFGCFGCALNDKTFDGFSVIFYNESNLFSQNKALKKGIILSAENGVDAEVLLPESDIKYKYISGQKHEYNSVDCGDTKPSADQIIKIIKRAEYHNEDKNDEEIEAESSEIDYDELFLKEVLKQSEQYSILSSELEEKKTHEMGQISYRELYATDYDRIDRVAYAFIVDDIDKSLFDIGTQVEFEGKHSERINGEIVEIDLSDNENKKIVVLFNKQVSVDSLASFGFISLSFSTMNKDVQLAANQKIASGVSKAKFMKNVLGGNKTAGFEDKDLSELIYNLENQKPYPPNKSQITAIEKGIKSKDVFLVMGPPGTGKTTVILEWVKYFVNVERKRVLVSSQNNKAVDNVLARLAEEKDIDVIRIGSESKLQDDVKDYMFEKKLVRLNDSIDIATQNNLLKLESAISNWSEYRKRFMIFSKQLSEVDEINDQYKESVDNQLKPIKIRQDRFFEETKRQKNEFDLKNNKLTELRDNIEKHNSKNIILRKLEEAQYKEDVALAQKIEQELVLLKDEIARNEADYSKYSAMYTETEQMLKQKYEHDIARTQKKKIQGYENLNLDLPKVPRIAHLFESIVIFKDDLDSPIRLRSLLDRIDGEIIRAQKLLDNEKQWREDIVGKQNYALNEIILETVDLVGATCIGVSSQKRFANLQFDVTIIDEAGQIQIHNALVPMSVSNKLIMLGDYKQIPPSADQELIEACEINGVDPELLKKSLFEKMFNELPDSNKMMLDTQYRMPGEIADTISEWFYNGEYKSPDFKRSMKGLMPELSDKPFIVVDTSDVKDRYEQRTPERGTFNVLESEICKQIVRHVIGEKLDIKMSEIGVISAYGDQVARIKKALKGVVPPETANSMVATLDSFQGQERDLIIYSFTKSSKKKPTMSRIGFLNELRRLNVAMSRCKKTLVMIGDMRFLAGCLYQELDDMEEPIYEHSEKEFSDFIKKMLDDVNGGRGELMSYAEFAKRIALDG